jgi:hypothetical protein
LGGIRDHLMYNRNYHDIKLCTFPVSSIDLEIRIIRNGVPKRIDGA